FFKGDGPSNSNVFDNNNRILYNNLSENLWKYRNQDYSLNFKQDFEKDDHHIVLDAIYSTSNNDDFRDFRNEFPILNAPHLYVEKRDGGNDNIRINLDYTNQIIDGGKIESGIQFRQEKTDNQMISTQMFDFIDEEGQIISYNPDVNYDFERSEEHTSELQSREKLVCRLL